MDGERPDELHVGLNEGACLNGSDFEGSVTRAPEIDPTFAAGGLAPGSSFARRRAAQWHA